MKVLYVVLVSVTAFGLGLGYSFLSKGEVSDEIKNNALVDKASIVAEGVAGFYNGGGLQFLETVNLPQNVDSKIELYYKDLIDNSPTELNLTEYMGDIDEFLSDGVAVDGEDYVPVYDSNPNDDSDEYSPELQYDPRVYERDGNYYISYADLNFVNFMDTVTVHGIPVTVYKDEIPLTYEQMVEDTASTYSLLKHSFMDDKVTGKRYLDFSFVALRGESRLLVRFIVDDGDIVDVEVSRS